MFMHKTVLMTLRQLARHPKQAVHAPGHGLRVPVRGEIVTVGDYIVYEGWAREIWKDGNLDGLQITEEGIAWLAELERQYREDITRR